MARYNVRPGIVLTSICGESILVAAKSVLEYCPYVTQLNETSAFLWKLLAAGADDNELIDSVKEEYEIDDEAFVRRAIEDFIKQMLDLNYLLPVEQKGKHEE